MRYIGRLLGYICLGVNAVVAALLFFSSYSPYLNPQTYPIASCAGLFFPIFLLLNLMFLVFWLVIYRKYALLPLLTLLVCWGAVRAYIPINLPGGQVPEEAIKVLSFNTRAFGEMKPHTKEKPNEVLEYLQNSDADIICLQEYIYGQGLKKKDIDYALRAYPYKHYLPLNKQWNGLGCYSRYPILSATPIKYDTNLNGSVAYRIKVGNDTLLVINNHLESNKILGSDVEAYHDMLENPDGEKLYVSTRKLLKKISDATAVRAKQADVVVETVKNAGEKNVIVCGDFNDTPVSYTHRVFQDVLKDAFIETGNGCGISYNRNRMYVRIDHLLVSEGMDVYECRVDDSVSASDHYPIWCYITLRHE